MHAPSSDSGPPPGGTAPTGRVALVLGGTGQMGSAVVRQLAARGFSLAIHGHRGLAAARATAESLTAAGLPSLAVTANLRDEGATRTTIHRVADHFGRLDAVVWCAALNRPCPLDELAADDLQAHFDVNVVAACVAATEAGRLMAGQDDGGAIVLVAAASPDHVPAGATAFLVSQAAVPALSRALAGGFAARGSAVRVNCVLRTAPSAGAATAASIDTAARAIVAVVENPGLSGACLTI